MSLLSLTSSPDGARAKSAREADRARLCVTGSVLHDIDFPPCLRRDRKVLNLRYCLGDSRDTRNVERREAHRGRAIGDVIFERR